MAPLNVIDAALCGLVNAFPFSACRRPAGRAGEAGNNRADLRSRRQPVDQRWNRLGWLPKFPGNASSFARNRRSRINRRARFTQVCIEMGFAAVALRYAFPVTVYAQNCAMDSRGRTVTMQSISSSLKVQRSTTLFNDTL